MLSVLKQLQICFVIMLTRLVSERNFLPVSKFKKKFRFSQNVLPLLDPHIQVEIKNVKNIQILDSKYVLLWFNRFRQTRQIYIHRIYYGMPRALTISTNQKSTTNWQTSKQDCQITINVRGTPRKERWQRICHNYQTIVTYYKSYFTNYLNFKKFISVFK